MRTLEVRVKPNARVSTFELGADGRWMAHLKATPIDGKANAELIALIAKQFGLRKSDVSIKSGSSGRTKRIALPDLTG